jgi:hypothetical protein
MGPRDLAEMDELLDDLGEILFSVNPSVIALQYDDPKTKDFRGRLAELRTRSAELVKNFPRDSFPLVARAGKKFSNRVNLLVKGSAATVRHSATGYYYKLERLIDDLLATNSFGLSRNALGALPKLKRIGDWGTHNRNILIRESDIEEIKAEARLCFEELLKLA